MSGIIAVIVSWVETWPITNLDIAAAVAQFWSD